MKKTNRFLCTTIVVVLAMLFAVSPCKAQSKNSEAMTDGTQVVNEVVRNPIIGVWQQCIISKDPNGQEIINVTPALKILNADNTYSGMFVYGMGQPGMVLQRGEFNMINDSTYHENIIRHSNKMLEGTVSVMKFKFVDDKKNIMEVEYKNSSIAFPSKECWIRLVPLE